MTRRRRPVADSPCWFPQPRLLPTLTEHHVQDPRLEVLLGIPLEYDASAATLAACGTSKMVPPALMLGAGARVHHGLFSWLFSRPPSSSRLQPPRVTQTGDP